MDRVLAQVGKRVVRCADRGGTITVEACSTVRAAPCPNCRSWSGRLHGRYVRHLAERPVLDRRVVLAVEMRRFRCLNSTCPRRTFAEDVHALAARHQRRRARRPRRCRRLATLSAGYCQLVGPLRAWARI